MLNFLLIFLALLGIWKLMNHSPVNETALLIGLRRLALVLAITGALLGGLLGYALTRNCTTDTTATLWVSTCSGPDLGGILLGAALGFAIVWGAASVVLWVLRGFLAR